MDYIASCSFGKDSLAMVLKLIENHRPLDEVVFYDTGREFDAIYRNRDKLVKILNAEGIKYTELHPENSFDYYMFDHERTRRADGETIKGYQWCGGACRWGTRMKIDALDKYTKKAFVHYVGIALDEPERIARLKSPKYAPLYHEWQMSEAACLYYCYSHGWDWLEDGPDGKVELYQILDRVSCWCCANKNKKELYNIYKYLPHYWEKLKEIQARCDRPMKNYQDKAHGCYGNIFELEKVFMKGETNA